MLKKIWAIVLSLALVLSVFPVTGVFADGKPAAMVETFEDGEADSSITALNTYAFTQNVAEGVGKGGGKALSITDIVNGSCVGFNHIHNTNSNTTEAVYLSYDIQFKTLPATITESTGMIIAGGSPSGVGTRVRVQGKTVDGETKLYFTDGSNAFSNGVVEAGKWYKIVYMKNQGVAANGTTVVQSNIGAVLDEAGNLIGFNRKGSDSSKHEGFSIIRATSDFTGAEILVDNVKFSTYDRTTYGPSVMETYIESGADGNVSRTAKSMVVVFEEALKTTPTATLTPAEGSAITCSVSKLYITDSTTSMIYKISWTGDLAAGTNYTLAISGANEAGKAIDGTVNFATAPATLEDEVLRDDFEDASEFSAEDSDGCRLYNTDYSTDTRKPFASAGHQGAFPVEGFDGEGTTAVEIRYNQKCKTGTYTALSSSVPYVFGDNNGVVVTYKMKINNAEVTGADGDFGGGTNAWIGCYTGNQRNSQLQAPYTVAVIDLDQSTGKHYIGASDCNKPDPEQAGERGFYYTEDTWYNVTYAANKTESRFVLTDIETGNVLWKNVKSMSNTSAYGYFINIANLRAREEKEGDVVVDNENGEGAAIIIDDVSLWQINDTENALHKLTADASSNENVVTFNFNQPTLVTADMLKVYKGDELNIEVEDVDFSIAYPNDVNFAKNIVTVLGLEPGETYTLEYSRITSAGGASFASGETVTKLITISAPDTTMMTAAEYNETTGKVNLKFWAQGNETAGRFIAAFYQAGTAKNLVAAAVSENENFVAGKNEIEISVTKDVSDATSLVIYAWDGLGNITPLCVPTKTIAINTENVSTEE